MHSSQHLKPGHPVVCKKGLMGIPNREPQEHGRNKKEYKGPYKDSGRYRPILFLCSWGSLFGVPVKVPLVCTQTRAQGYFNDLWVISVEV